MQGEEIVVFGFPLAGVLGYRGGMPWSQLALQPGPRPRRRDGIAYLGRPSNPTARKLVSIDPLRR